jgi:hypothetical protein
LWQFAYNKNHHFINDIFSGFYQSHKVVQLPPLSNSRTFKSLLNPDPLAVIPHHSLSLPHFFSTPLPATGNHAPSCLQLCQFLTFNINEMKQYVAFCVLLLSFSMFLRFIHVVACVSTSSIFMTEYCMNIKHFVKPFISWWTLACF